MKKIDSWIVLVHVWFLMKYIPLQKKVMKKADKGMSGKSVTSNMEINSKRLKEQSHVEELERLVL